MAPKTQSKMTVVGRIIPAIAMWGIGKVLATPRVAKASEKLDRKAGKKTNAMLRSMKKAGSNAAENRGWLAAGAAAFAIGIGLMAKAAKGK